MAIPTIIVTKAAARHLRRGHPWIWEKGVAKISGPPNLGEVVRVAGEGRTRVFGFAFFDPSSPIRARMVGLGDRVDADWARALIARACSLRTGLRSLQTTDAMRLVHGEADGASGLVIDRYGSVATVRLDGPAAEAFWRPLFEPIFDELRAVGIKTLFVRGEGAVLGEPPPSPLIVSEDDARFEVDLEHGQKTGLFLDQRPNRRRVAKLATGRVLNLCCYTGGFSVHAALGGASEVTSVDIAGPAVAAAERNFAHSGLRAADHEFVTSDVFEFLGKKRRAFDVVVCDPPSFAPRRKAVAKAERAYAALNRAAISAVKRGGILVTASCSSHITREQFALAVAEGAARARREAQVIATSTAGSDHPSRAGFPEGDYLKVLTIYSA